MAERNRQIAGFDSDMFRKKDCQSGLFWKLFGGGRGLLKNHKNLSVLR